MFLDSCIAALCKAFAWASHKQQRSIVICYVVHKLECRRR